MTPRPSLPAHIACPHGERLVRRDAAAPFFIRIDSVGVARSSRHCQCLRSDQLQLICIERASAQCIADHRVMCTKHVRNVMDGIAVPAQKLGGKPLYWAKALAPNLDVVDKHPCDGMPFSCHGTFLSWLLARLVSVTPATHLGLLFSRYRGAVSPGPDISEVSGPNLLHEISEIRNETSLLTGMIHINPVSRFVARSDGPDRNVSDRQDTNSIRPGRADARRALSRFLSVVPARWFGVFPSGQRFGGERA